MVPSWRLRVSMSKFQWTRSILAFLIWKTKQQRNSYFFPVGSNLIEGKSAGLVSVPDVRYSREAYSSFANRFTSVLILPGEAAQRFAANLAIASFPLIVSPVGTISHSMS